MTRRWQCNHLRKPNCPKRNKMQIMHTVHNVTEDIDEFTSSPRVFFVTNKIIHGSLQGAMETEEVILQDWIQRENVCKDLLQHCIINISTLWQWDGEELCTHLHEQSLLPQFLVEDENIRICPDHAWVKVHDPQTLQTPSPGQSHISLAALKHTCQRDFHAVQRHSLKWEKTNKDWSQVRMTASYLYVWAQTGHLQGDFLAERSLHLKDFLTVKLFSDSDEQNPHNTLLFFGIITLLHPLIWRDVGFYFPPLHLLCCRSNTGDTLVVTNELNYPRGTLYSSPTNFRVWGQDIE